MAEASTVSSKFHQDNSIFITATDEINASEVETYMKERILKGDFLANTKFVMVAGSHHGVNRNGEIVIGKTDYVLLQSFEHKVFSNLSKLKDKDGNNIWDEMNFDDELVTIACDEHLNFQPPFETTYELSERSQKKLTNLCDDLCNQTRPFCVVFASCYSYQSPIKDFMIEKGLLAAIDISKDQWEITGGRIFKFDKDQKEINDEFTNAGCCTKIYYISFHDINCCSNNTGPNQKFVSDWITWYWQNSCFGCSFETKSSLLQ